MLAKQNRAITKEVDRLFKEGRVLSSPALSFKYIKTNSAEIKISFIAPKAVVKSAVKRNFLRRRGYNALEKNIKLSPAGLLGVFIFKKYQDDLLILENEIKSIFNKTN